MVTNNPFNKAVSTLFEDPINTGANIWGTALSQQSLDIAKQSLDISKKAYDLSLKLYNEFEETHNTEDLRYQEGKLIQQTQMELLKEILVELKKLNDK